MKAGSNGRRTTPCSKPFRKNTPRIGKNLSGMDGAEKFNPREWLQAEKGSYTFLTDGKKDEFWPIEVEGVHPVREGGKTLYRVNTLQFEKGNILRLVTSDYEVDTARWAKLHAVALKLARPDGGILAADE